MYSPAFLPLGIAISICLVCAVAGGRVPHKYFQEWQPATIYNFVQLTLCAVVAATIAGTRSSKPRVQLFSTAFWSISCAACAFLAVDELLQFYERPGPVVQLSCFVIVTAIAWLFRREIFLPTASVWLFALAVVFLISSAFLNLALINDHHTVLNALIPFSYGVYETLAESLEVAGFAMVLGGLMETLLAKRQMLSIDKMISRLSQSRSSLNHDQCNLVDA